LFASHGNCENVFRFGEKELALSVAIEVTPKQAALVWLVRIEIAFRVKHLHRKVNFRIREYAVLGQRTEGVRLSKNLRRFFGKNAVAVS
jgi:hypothetical protein